MVAGLMMDQPLTVMAILRHASRFHSNAQIVSRQLDGSIHRYSYDNFGRRVHRLANALVGVRKGDQITLSAKERHEIQCYQGRPLIGVHLRITDRTKDVIKSGGEWISSVELENIAMSHPDVAEAACIAIAHSKWGERPMLCVVPREKKTLDVTGLKAFYEGRVANWWIPDYVEVIEDMPHTATGKVSKLTLRQRFEGFRLPETNEQPDQNRVGGIRKG